MQFPWTRWLGQALLIHLICSTAFAVDDSTFPRKDIVGGSPASVYDYPFAVMVVSGAVAGSPRVCTGSLIEEPWVLTAAHCVDGVAGYDIGVMHRYPEYTENRLADRFVMHPDFDPLDRPEGWAHDLALIRLQSEFLSRTAVTVRMADSLDSLFVQSGLTMTAVGWGGDSTQESMTALEKSLTACSEIPEWTVCTESPVTPTIEGGDSGGPALMRRNDEWVLVAVNSWWNTSPDIYSRYVRVAEHREWIDEVMTAQPAEDTAPCSATVEPVTPVTPPGPPPAPLPFQPEPVEVTLGDSGSIVTLMTAEGGGSTLNGTAFAGGEVEAENGNRHLLSLEDGTWTATLAP